MLEADFICQRSVVNALLENSIAVAVTLLVRQKLAVTVLHLFL